MMPLISFIGVTAVLFAEGYLLMSIILRRCDDVNLSIALAYPLGVFIQTILFFVLAMCGFSWTLPSIGVAHAVLLIVLSIVRFCTSRSTIAASSIEDAKPIVLHRALFFCCVVIIGVIAASSITYAFTIPSFYWDAFTNWAMRSKQSFVAGKMLIEGVVQPQYPILMHSLQISPMLAAGWHDWLANGMTMMLSLTGFSSLFLLVRRAHGTQVAMLILALILGVPLVIIHLRQGYADVHLSMYILLSAALFDRACRTHDARTLLLSSIFCAAAMWTKLEGLYAGVILLMFILCVHALQTKRWRLCVRWGILPLLLLTLPWISFLWLSGLKTSPHGFRPAWHPEAVPLFFHQLLMQGMFGLHWWAIFSLLIVIVATQGRRLRSLSETQPSLLWGIASLVFFTFTYLCTDEVSGLVHADNFSRAMMMPTLLLTYAIGEYWHALRDVS